MCVSGAVLGSWRENPVATLEQEQSTQVSGGGSHLLCNYAYASN